MGRGHRLGRTMNGGYWYVDGARRVVIGTASRACDRQIVLVFTEDIGAEDRQIDIVHRYLTHLREVDGHLPRLQMKEACLIDD